MSERIHRLLYTPWNKILERLHLDRKESRVDIKTDLCYGEMWIKKETEKSMAQRFAEIKLQTLDNIDEKIQTLSAYSKLISDFDTLLYEEFELPYTKYYNQKLFNQVSKERAMVETDLLNVYHYVYIKYGDDIQYCKHFVDAAKHIHEFRERMIQHSLMKEKMLKKYEDYIKTKENPIDRPAFWFCDMGGAHHK
jgi:hypothetical protein